MRRHGTHVRRHRLAARRPAAQGAVAHPRPLRPAAARSETRRLGPLPFQRLDARTAHPQGFVGPRDLPQQGPCRAPGPREPLDHLQRILSGHRRHDDDLLVQGDRGVQRLRARRGRREAHPGRRLGRKHRPGLRQGVLRQPHSAAALGALRQYRRPVVRPSARPVRAADLVRRRGRLFRRHPPGRHGPEDPALLRRGRCEEHRAPRRHGLHGALGRTSCA